MSIKINLQLSGEIELPDPLNVAIKELPAINLTPEVLEKLTSLLVSLSPETLAELRSMLFTDDYWTKFVDSLQKGVVIGPTEPEPEPEPKPEPEPEPDPITSTLMQPGYGPPSSDSRIVYVSSSTGLDTNNGLSETTPKKTIAAGYSLLRSDYPDRLLLKKGDTWYETLGVWKKCGRSPQEPMVIGSYGTGPRPLLKTGGNNGIACFGSSGTPVVMHSVTLSGIAFYAHTRDPQSPEFSGSQTSPNGVRWLRGGHDIIIDDCSFTYYHTTIVIQDYENTGMQNMTVRGCVVVDSYSDNTGHSQGIYCSGVAGLLVEDCVFDHNGWCTAFPGATATIFNHNMYLQYSCTNVVTRRNILMRAASHAVQQRPGGPITDTFCWRNPIGPQFGSAENPNQGNVVGTITNCVVLEGTDITPSLPRGWGIFYDEKDCLSVTISDNIVANVVNQNGINDLSILDRPEGVVTGNIVWRWPSRWGGVNTKFDSPGPFKDPNRTLNGYQGLTEAQVIENIRSQSRDTFNPNYTAQALNSYIRAGFVPA